MNQTEETKTEPEEDLSNYGHPPFEIAITYCDGVNFVHTHYQVRPAMQEYAELLEAIYTQEDQPVVEGAPIKHIRLVSMMHYIDEAQPLTWSIDTGIRTCEHNPEL